MNDNSEVCVWRRAHTGGRFYMWASSCDGRCKGKTMRDSEINPTPNKCPACSKPIQIGEDDE